MTTLLHIDSSAIDQGSVSREVSATFRREWAAQHPDSTVIYRDLAADPIPHLNAAGITSAFSAPADRTPEQQTAYALRDRLAAELEQADAILIGAPMYNFTIPATLKVWLDQAIIMGRTGGEQPTAAGTPVTVVASRGGSYAPGTPRESFEFVQNYLEKVLGEFMGLDVDFIIPEFTAARVNPALADFVEESDASRDMAHEQATVKAKAVAARIAA